MTEDSATLYEYPQFYDGLFNRDYGVENDFLVECLRKHGTAAAQDRSVLELGCGPAHNSREFAKRGYRAVALDLEPSMLAYAQKGAQREGVTIETLQGNMIDFDLAQPVSLTFCLWDTILLVRSNDDMVSHLRAVARNLRPGGVYVIETSHPRQFMLNYTGVPFRSRSGDLDVEVTWGLPTDRYNCLTQCYAATIRTIARRNGQIVAATEETLIQRYYQVQELRALIALSGAFSEVHYYGRTDLPLTPLTLAPECNGCLTILVKSDKE